MGLFKGIDKRSDGPPADPLKGFFRGVKRAVKGLKQRGRALFGKRAKANVPLPPTPGKIGGGIFSGPAVAKLPPVGKFVGTTPETGKYVGGGFLGRRPDLGEDPHDDYEKPFAPADIEDRYLTPDQVEEFLRGDVVLFVDSSWIESMGYKPDRQELTLTFLNTSKRRGKVYSQVTLDMARQFVVNHSKGITCWNLLLVRGKGNKGRTRVPSRDL